MTLYGDYASIAATTAGVSGNITVPVGARILGLNLNFKGDGGIISSVELTHSGWPKPLKFVPKLMTQTTATNTLGLAAAPVPLIDLSGFGLIAKGNTVTVTITTTANETVIAGLIWTS